MREVKPPGPWAWATGVDGDKRMLAASNTINANALTVNFRRLE